jgi:hypothetical protein
MLLKDLTITDLSEFDFTDWVLAAKVRTRVMELLEMSEGTKLPETQWRKLKSRLGLVASNQKGEWFLIDKTYLPEIEIDGTEEVEKEVPTETPIAKPQLVTFGDFSQSLAVVNNVSGDAIQVHNHSFNTGTLATEADSFVSQLGAFTGFLENAEKMLLQREADLENQTRIKAEAVNQAKLTVETIKQRTLLAQKRNIAVKVLNDAIDGEMLETIEVGKHLYETLNSLQE